MHHDITTELEIVALWPLTQLRYLRESTRATPSEGRKFLSTDRYHLGPDGSTTVAYALSGDGLSVRFWWVWSPLSHLDGADPPRDLDETAYRIVASSIRAGQPTDAWAGLTLPHRRGERLTRKPQRLLDRFEKWETRFRPRVMPGRIGRLRNRIRAFWRRSKW